MKTKLTNRWAGGLAGAAGVLAAIASGATSVTGTTAAGVALPVAHVMGCTGTECLGSFSDVFTGRMADANTWESNGIDDNWQHYTPEVTMTFHIPELYGREVTSLIAYLSPVQSPNVFTPLGVNNYTIGSGNVAEFQKVWQVAASGGEPNHLQVVLHNDSCAEYWTRVVVQVAAVDDAGAPGTDLDGGADAADASDAADANSPTDAGLNGDGS